MMTPKEALQKDGTIPVVMGKGRLPRGGDVRCQWLVDNKGWNIKGYLPNKSVPMSSTAPVKVNKVAPQNVKVVQDFTILYDERTYKAVTSEGKEYGMREVCNTCRVSLVQNMCEHPSILGGIAVSIVAR